MTRFARAKGSKASNEKAPEESTPWEVMREQLLQAKKESEDAKKRKEAENQRIENYENFLKERKVQKRNATWCDFPEMEQDKKKASTVLNGAPNKKKKRKNKQPNTENRPTIADIGLTVEKDSTSNIVSNGEKKKNNNKNKNKVSEVETSSAEPSQQIPENQQIKKKKKKKNKQNMHVSVEQGSVEKDSSSNTVLNEEKKNNNKNKNKVNELETTSAEPSQQIPGNQQTKKKKKKNEQNVHVSVEHAKEPNSVLENGRNSQVNIAVENNKKNKKKRNKNKPCPTENENSNKTVEITENSIKNNQTANTNKQNKIKALIKKKNKTLVDGKPVRRKEITERSFQLILNGKEVELVRFDGFPIMKKDAERLAELRQSMLQKGIPKSEVQRTMKLERRRAEKALTRMKRDVCYNCRKGGHNLSDCPELKSKIPGVDAAEGVCFKCGSTEHRQFECKVQIDKEFRFATCFICKEPGHIARQCPDNPKGLYPNGGCCKLCGDVTHLRKDCPTINEKKEETSVKLQTLDATENIEDIGQQSKTTFTEEIKKPKKIKF